MTFVKPRLKRKNDCLPCHNIQTSSRWASLSSNWQSPIINNMLLLKIYLEFPFCNKMLKHIHVHTNAHTHIYTYRYIHILSTFYVCIKGCYFLTLYEINLLLLLTLTEDPQLSWEAGFQARWMLSSWMLEKRNYLGYWNFQVSETKGHWGIAI